MINATLRGKPDAGNPHVRFDEGEVAPAKPRRGSLLYKCVFSVLFAAAAFVAVADEYPLGKYWATKRIGAKDFYVTEHGNYSRDRPEFERRFREAGIFPLMKPGYYMLEWFEPEREATMPTVQKRKRDQYLNEGIPFWSINYQRILGKPCPSAAAIAATKGLWLGDGHAEEPIYRHEAPFDFAQTGAKGVSPSSHIWKDAEALRFLGEELKPALDAALPGWSTKDYAWTRARLQTFKETYCRTYLRVNPRPNCWTMYLAPESILADRPDLPAVFAKAGDARELAVQRGLARLYGGKFLAVSRGHEPTERYTYDSGKWFNTPEQESHGLPGPHLVYYVFRPYLGGVNLYGNETFAGALIEDREDNGTWHPSPLGKVVRKMMQFAEDHPDRGVLYTPVAFVMGYDREFEPARYCARIQPDDADWMHYALMRDVFFPEHRDVRNTGSYSCLAPCGELIDVLKPDPRRPVDPHAFDGYKLVILGADITWSDSYRAVIADLEKKGVKVLWLDPREALTKERVETVEHRTSTRVRRPLIRPDFQRRLEREIANVSPFALEVAPESKEDFSFTVYRKGRNWRVVVYNYSLRREELIVTDRRTANARASYPYKSVPFRLVANVPVRDCVEIFGCRDVKREIKDGHFAVTESMSGGELRLYEFSADRIELDEIVRPVNYALNRPVKASSVYKEYAGALAVDGNRDNGDYWQSDGARMFDLPQTLEVDLGEKKTIDRVFVQFHVWEDTEPDVRQHAYRFRIEATSDDGKTWKTVVDESHNETPADVDGWEMFFDPVEAKQVRLVVLHNTGNSGASVVSFEVSGADRTRYRPKRISLRKPWEVEFPPEIASATDVRYLTGMNPISVKPGWMPEGKTWKQLCGWVRLYTGFDYRNGLVCTKSLYGESSFEAEYEIPAGYDTFVSICGFGNPSRVASVTFEVYVDGRKTYDSGVFRCGVPLLPVVVDVKGAKRLRLVTTDGGDNGLGDYAWWGDARFVKRDKR